MVWGQIFPGSISRVVFVPHPGGNMPNGEISRAGLGAPQGHQSVGVGTDRSLKTMLLDQQT